MKNLSELMKYCCNMGSDGGAFVVPSPIDKQEMVVIASNGLDWDHVSVSRKSRCPNWIEMSYIKDLFFKEDETVLQYHPAKSDYVNIHPYCLHMWRPHKLDIPKPPTEFV